MIKFDDWRLFPVRSQFIRDILPGVPFERVERRNIGRIDLESAAQAKPVQGVQPPQVGCNDGRERAGFSVWDHFSVDSATCLGSAPHLAKASSG